MKRILLYIVLGLQIAGLAGLYAWHANLPAARYLLRTRPVDPRDLLRGDYITLGYEISTPPSGVQPPENGEGKIVFVRLKPDARFWVADRVADSPRDDGAPWLRARWKHQALDYGIDRYYVPEGKGNPTGEITAEIAIQENGTAQITQLYHDDQPWP